MNELTAEQLDAIDAIADVSGRRTLCAIPHVEVDLVSNEIRSKTDFTTYADLPMFHFRRPYEKSLWVRRDSDNRCFPELLVLASLKFGVLRDRKRMPYWTDRDYTNSTMANVTLPEEKIVTVVKKSGIIARSGTKEYWKEYYANPEHQRKRREASRNHARRKREEARNILAGLTPEELAVLTANVLQHPYLKDPIVIKNLQVEAEMLSKVTRMPMKNALELVRDEYIGRIRVNVTTTEDTNDLPDGM